MTERKERCETCRFWMKMENEHTTGDCHRHAPSPVLIDQLPDGDNTSDGGDYVWWPVLLKADWCGEWTPVDTPAAKAPQLLGVDDVSQRLGVTARQAKVIMNGIEAVRLNRSEIAVTEKSLAKWIADNTEQPE